LPRSQKDNRIRDLEADKQQMSQEIKLLKEKIDFLPFRIHALRLKIVKDSGPFPPAKPLQRLFQLAKLTVRRDSKGANAREGSVADRWARRFTVTLFARQSPERESIFGPAMRKISPIREWRCVLAVLILVPAFQPCAHAQQARKFSPKVLEVLNTPPLEIKDDEDPLVRLKKERFNAALNEAKARFDLYKRGLTKSPDLIEVGERLFSAEVDLYGKPEDRARVLQRQLDVYNEAVANLENQVKEGLAPQVDLERLRYNKASLEIELLTAKSELSQPHPSPQ
jgi:hypothetical protein